MLNNLVAWALTTGRVRLLSDGTPWRPIVHIEDIARAFLAVLEAPREAVHDRAWNVGRTAENYRIRELAEIVAATVPGTEVELAAGAGPDARNYRVELRPHRRTTCRGSSPVGTPAPAPASSIDAYRAQGLTFELFNGPSFKRLPAIEAHQRAGRLDDRLRWTAVAVH